MHVNRHVYMNKHVASKLCDISFKSFVANIDLSRQIGVVLRMSHSVKINYLSR